MVCNYLFLPLSQINYANQTDLSTSLDGLALLSEH